VFLLIVLCPVCFGQTAYENEAKYWVWRDRLINDFMAPGYCTGCGILLSTRGSDFTPEFTNKHWYAGGFDISDEGLELANIN